jgi:hypothetical protein
MINFRNFCSQNEVLTNFSSSWGVNLIRGEIIVGITAQSVLEFPGIPWNSMELFGIILGITNKNP